VKTFLWWGFFVAGVVLMGNGIGRLECFDYRAGNGLFIGIVMVATFMHLQGFAIGQQTERRVWQVKERTKR